MYNKTIVRFDVCDIQNNQGRGMDYQPKPKWRSFLKNAKS